MRDAARRRVRAAALAGTLAAALATGAHAGPLGVRADDASACHAPAYRQLQVDPTAPTAPPPPTPDVGRSTEVTRFAAPPAPHPADLAPIRARDARAPPAHGA
ncbi:MAG: hypothetical protein RI554_02630 [Trueperaceae bacterium]|nr:hypothetical protein [Trueperaceae bacterium]